MRLELTDVLALLEVLLENQPAKGKQRANFTTRLHQLRDLVVEKNTAEPFLEDVNARLFRGVARNSLRPTFATFRKALGAAAAAAGHRLDFLRPDARSEDLSGLRCWFEGDSLIDSRTSAVSRESMLESVSREAVAAAGPVEYIEMDAWPDEPRFFVSFAVAETRLVDAFMRELLANLPLRCRHRVSYWRFDEVTAASGIVPGEENEAEIRQAMARCQFGLLLVSPTYLSRPFIQRVELPYFTGRESKAPAVPVALADFSPGQDKHPIFDSKNVFALKGRPYNQLSTPKQRADFIKGLAGCIESFLDRERRRAIGSAADTGPDPATRTAQEVLDEETRRQLGEYFPGDAKHETALGRGSRSSFERAPADEEPSREGAVSLLGALDEWARGGDRSTAYMALLGETGAGKTMTCLEFTRRFLDDGSADPAVIYLDLRRANEDGLLKRSERPLLAEIMDAVLRRTGSGHHADSAELLRAVRERRAVLVWDGLDEVLVHLSHEAGQAFFRQLLEALPPRLAAKPGAGQLLFACRTQYFRDLDHEADLFTGGQKEGLPVDGILPARARFTVLRVLPFSDDQVRGYLAQNVPGLDVDRACEVIRTVHNLRELAGRPYLLSLMRESLSGLDADLAAGRTVRPVDLYDRLVNRWLEREKTREAIGRGHKRRLMQRLAAHLWREGIRSLRVDLLDDWLERLVVTDPFFAAAMSQRWAADGADCLREHLRAATFLGRWESSHFRFAHTSLQEYFLACHLAESLEHGGAEEWDLPLPSDETLDFFGQRLASAEKPAAGRILSAWTALLDSPGAPAPARRAAFRAWLIARDKGWPMPAPRSAQLQDLDLEWWRLGGTEGPVLDLCEANLENACLSHAVLTRVLLTAARADGASARLVEWQDVSLANSSWERADFTGGIGRDCDARSLHARTAVWHDFDAVRFETGGAQLPEDWAWEVAASLPAFPSALSLTLRQGHADWVRSVAWSPDGKRLLSGSNDHTMKVWDAASGRCLLSLAGHTGPVRSVAWSPDGTRLLSGSADKSVRLWDAAGGHCLLSIDGHIRPIQSVAWSPDGTRLLSGSVDHTMKVWDAASGRCLLSLEGHMGPVQSVAWSPDGEYLLSGSNDRTAKVWDAAGGRCLLSLVGHKNLVQSVVWSPDGTRLLSGSADKSMKVWDAASGRCLLSLEGHMGPVQCVAWSPDGEHLLSGSADKSVKVWNAVSGRCLLSRVDHMQRVGSVAWSPDGGRLLSGSWDHSMKIWEAVSGRCLLTLVGNTNRVQSVAWSPDGTRMVSGSLDHGVKVWDATSGRCLLSIVEHMGPVQSVAWSPDGTRLLSGSWDHSVKIWDAASGRCLLSLEGHMGPVQCVAWSPDGARLASGSWDDTVKIWDAASGRFLLTVSEHESSVQSLAWSPDGTRVVSSDWDDTVKVWDAANGRCLLSLLNQTSPVQNVAWSPDGACLLSGSLDHTVKVWDATSGRCLLSTDEHASPVQCVAWSPDGTRLFSGSLDHTVKVWDATSGRCLLSLLGHMNGVLSVAWSPDGARLLSSGGDATIREWDATTGRLLRTWLDMGGETALLDFAGSRILHATSGSWRHLGWQGYDQAAKRRRLFPAEAFGPLPAW